MRHKRKTDADRRVTTHAGPAPNPQSQAIDLTATRVEPNRDTSKLREPRPTGKCRKRVLSLEGRTQPGYVNTGAAKQNTGHPVRRVRPPPELSVRARTSGVHPHTTEGYTFRALLITPATFQTKLARECGRSPRSSPLSCTGTQQTATGRRSMPRAAACVRRVSATTLYTSERLRVAK